MIKNSKEQIPNPNEKCMVYDWNLEFVFLEFAQVHNLS